MFRFIELLCICTLYAHDNVNDGNLITIKPERASTKTNQINCLNVIYFQVASLKLVFHTILIYFPKR